MTVENETIRSTQKFWKRERRHLESYTRTYEMAYYKVWPGKTQEENNFIKKNKEGAAHLVWVADKAQHTTILEGPIFTKNGIEIFEDTK